MKKRQQRALLGGTAASALVVAPLLIAAPASAAGTVTDLTAAEPESLVQALLGDDTPVSNVQFTGADGAAGTFSGLTDTGISDGVVLSSGFVAGDTSAILGPNSGPEVTGELGMAGDTDLDAIVAPNSTNDATVLEFDFVPDGDTVTFSYVFGSDEYPEYANSLYNDVFAFYVNGTNRAVFTDDAGAEQAVSINNINHEDNPGLYIDNTDGSKDTEMDGFTTVLGFEAPVNAGQTNHIKLAIADTSDSVLDSSVLLQSGSFQTNQPPVAGDVDAGELEADETATVPFDGSDPDGDALTYEIVDAPPADRAAVALSADGQSVEITPAAGYLGPISFTYRAHDGSVGSNVATITAEVVEAVNEPPVTNDITGWEVAPGEQITIPFDGTDPDGDALTYEIVDAPPAEQGAVELSADGQSVVFTAADDYAGEVVFTYRASDGELFSEPSDIAGTVAEPAAPAPNDDDDADGSRAGGSPDDAPSSGGTAAPAGTGLAATGADGAQIGWLAGGAAALILAGVGALLLRRRTQR